MTIKTQSVKELLTYPDIIRDNILEIWGQCNYNDLQEGERWYKAAFSFCEDLSISSGLTLEQVVAIISCTSPRKNWEENKKIATDFIMKGRKSHTKVQIDKCKAIKKITDYEAIINIISGPKTVDFFLCILNPDNDYTCCIDSHCLSIAAGSYIKDVTRNQYNIVKCIYVDLAKELNVRPIYLQSVVWCKYRVIKKINIYVEGPF